MGQEVIIHFNCVTHRAPAVLVEFSLSLFLLLPYVTCRCSKFKRRASFVCCCCWLNCEQHNIQHKPQTKRVHLSILLIPFSLSLLLSNLHSLPLGSLTVPVLLAPSASSDQELEYELEMERRNNVKMPALKQPRNGVQMADSSNDISLVNPRPDHIHSQQTYNNSVQFDKLNGRQANHLAPNQSSLSGTWTTATRNMWPASSTQLNALESLSPHAGLIQWTILVGSLLLIVLLIMLIVRKLFFSAFQPSYHWMLAKQTLKSTSKLGAASSATSSTALDCCAPQADFIGGSQVVAQSSHHHHHNLHHQTFGLGNQQHAHQQAACPTSLVLDAQGRAQHHMCYAWRTNANGQQEPCSKPASSSIGSLNKTCAKHVHRCIVDAQGRHLLEGDFNNKNRLFINNNLVQSNDQACSSYLTSQHQQTTTTTNNSLNSNSSSHTTMKVATNALSTKYHQPQQYSLSQHQHSAPSDEVDFYDERNPMLFNVNNGSGTYNYDTLNSSSYEPQLRNSLKNDDGFVVTRDFIISTTTTSKHCDNNQNNNSSSQCELDNEKSCSYQDVAFLNINKSSNSNLTQAHSSRLTQNSVESTSAKKQDLSNKHWSPNVPLDNGRQDNLERMQYKNSNIGLVQQRSKSPSIASGDEPEEDSSSSNSGQRSSSVQSTTAPMLSQAASSSFEQTPDLPLTECSPPNTSSASIAQVSSTPNSSTASPAFNGIQRVHQARHQRNNSISKAANLPFNIVQSQPNSPMFVKQFVGGRTRPGARDEAKNPSASKSNTKVSCIAKRFQYQTQRESCEGAEYRIVADKQQTSQQYQVIENSSQSLSSKDKAPADVVNNKGRFVVGEQYTTRDIKPDEDDRHHYYEEIDRKT